MLAFQDATFQLAQMSAEFVKRHCSKAEQCSVTQRAQEETEVTVSGKGEDLTDIPGPFQMLDFPGDFPATDSYPAAVSGQTRRHWKYQGCQRQRHRDQSGQWTTVCQDQ